MKWLKVAAEEIISGIKRSIEELNIKEVEQIVEPLLKAKDKQRRQGNWRYSSCHNQLPRVSSRSDSRSHSNVKGRTKMGWPKEEDYLTRQLVGEREPLTLLGSIFENNCMVFLDGLIVELMHRLGRTEEDLKRRHATIEVE